MRTHLAETAHQLAAVLWQQHTVYRDRAGTMIIRGDHVQRWISIAPTGSRGEVLLRAGRILEGGTTAPARSEAVIPLAHGTTELAAACRRLLAEAATDAEAPRRPQRQPRAQEPRGRRKQKRQQGRNKQRRERRTPSRRTSFSSWVIIAAVAGTILLIALSTYGLLPGL